MDSEKWMRAQSIFHEAADKSPAARADLVKAECGSDEMLTGVVLRMLEEDARGNSVLDEGLGSTVSQLLDGETSRVPHQMFGPYKLLRLLGEGGMGVVYLAERGDLGSKAAIKILRDSALSPMRRQRFEVEQQMLAHLNHPSIARLYDADTLEDGTPFIVMEYVEGSPLNIYVERHQLSINDLLRLVRSICEAVQYAHAQAIIHRDLKPSNILVTDDGAVKLLDFGISKHMPPGDNGNGNTATAFRLLTPAYSAPEQIRCAPTGIQADVYSLGVILYEILAGRLPFDLSNQTPGQIERIIEREEPKPPSHFAKLHKTASWRIADLAWSELDTLCLTAMHKDQKQRYQSVEALIRDLDHYLKREPLEARPDSIRYRASKFVGRNRRALTWLTMTTMVLMAIAAYSTIRIAKARRATEAEVARTQQIQRFMLNLFNGGDVEAPSEDLRVTTLLDRGVQQAQMLEQDPETAAQLAQTLAGIYTSLGKVDRADPLLQSAFDKRMKLYGPNSPKVAETMTEIGLLRLQQAKPDEAERLTRAALAIDRGSLPPRDPSTAKAKFAVGWVLDERGRYSEAIPLLQQAVQVQSGRPELAADLAQSTSALATANYFNGNYPVAETLHRQALAIHEKLYGPLHPRVADDLVNLGAIQHDLGHDAEAEKLYRQGLQIKRNWYGERHPDTAFCMMAVGQSLVYQKRFDEALPFIQKSLEIQEEVYGKSHPRVAMALNTAGVLELRLGHYDAAERDFLRMADINRSVYGDRHYLVGVSILNLGQVYLDEKRYVLAEQSFKGALDRFEEKLPAGHPSIAIAQQKLGAVLVLEGKYKEAETPLLAAIESFNKQQPPATERLVNARKDLETVYQHLHESDKNSASIAQASIHRVQNSGP